LSTLCGCFFCGGTCAGAGEYGGTPGEEGIFKEGKQRVFEWKRGLFDENRGYFLEWEEQMGTQNRGMGTHNRGMGTQKGIYSTKTIPCFAFPSFFQDFSPLFKTLGDIS
jgi:hypothetical protein